MFGYILVAAIFIGILVGIGKSKERQRLKQIYDATLRGTDKAAALRAGRAYYQSLRGSKPLTIYDEQAIANDLSTMK